MIVTIRFRVKGAHPHDFLGISSGVCVATLTYSPVKMLSPSQLQKNEIAVRVFVFWAFKLGTKKVTDINA